LATTTGRRLPVHPLLLGALGATLLGFLLAPLPFLEKLQALSAGVCAQRPDHSYFVAGAQLPLEARMGGIFAGFLVGVLYLLWAGRERAAFLPPPALQAGLLGLVGLMGADGLNALLFDLGLPALYTPQNAIRLATGLLCGLALALLAVPVLSGSLWREADPEPSLGSAAELAGPLCLLGLVQVATMSGVPALLYPVALLMMVGVIVAFGVGNTYAVVLLTRAERRARTWGDTFNPLLGGALISLYELLALAALRYWAETAVGATWPV
jgi:uncharacterized membrane protein